MDILIKQVKIQSPGDPLHGKIRDIRIVDGIVSEIASKISNSKSKTIEIAGLEISPGWVDVGTQVPVPGFEHQENLQSLSNAATAGGYTHIISMPNAQPVRDSKSEIRYLIEQSNNLPIDIHSIGAISKKTKGEELAELMDMHHAGAIAYSDGNSCQNSQLLLRSLEYVKMFQGLIINHPDDQHISLQGQMHEGEISTFLGLKGIPNIAEEIGLQRDLSLLKYSDSRLLSHIISSKEAVQLIKKHKSDLNVFASVSVFNLCHDEQQLKQFNTNYKLSPPLRSKEDRKALIKGIAEQTIDIICSNHKPLDPEQKDLEFPYAVPGAISLETAFSSFMTYLDNALNIEHWIQTVAINPRMIFGLPEIQFKEGNTADFTLFHLNKSWVYHQENIQSLSKNTPYVSAHFNAKVCGTISKASLILQS